MTEKYILFMACYNDDCEAFGGGWVRTRAMDKKDIYKAMDAGEPDACPDCFMPLNYEIHVEDEAEKIRQEARKAKDLMSLRKALEAKGYNVNYRGELLPILTVEMDGKRFVITNKIYADNPIFIEGDLAGGWQR